MNNIDYLLFCIQREIPQELLLYSFCPPQVYGQLNYSLPHMLRSEVIEGWLLRDLNVMGGREVTVDISAGSYRMLENGFIVEIPQAALGGRNITSVLSIAYGQSSYVFNMPGSEMVDALSPMDRATEARVQLVGPNTIFVESNTIAPRTFLRCVLDNDIDFGNITARALPVLGDMAVLAAKALIWNKGIIRNNVSVSFAGAEIGKYGELVEGYVDAIELYKEKRDTKWRKVQFLQDPVSKNRYIRMLIPS